MSKPSYDDKLDELEQLRYERELKNSTPKKTKERLTPPVAVLRVNYVDPDGDEYDGNLDVRILSHDELLRVTQLASVFAGVDFDFLPEYGRRLCLAKATIMVMWSKDLPEWLKAAVDVDETISLQLYDAVTSHRAAWFRGDYRASGKSEKQGGMVLTQIKPATASDQ